MKGARDTEPQEPSRHQEKVKPKAESRLTTEPEKAILEQEKPSPEQVPETEERKEKPRTDPRP